MKAAADPIQIAPIYKRGCQLHPMATMAGLWACEKTAPNLKFRFVGDFARQKSLVRIEAKNEHGLVGPLVKGSVIGSGSYGVVMGYHYVDGTTGERYDFALKRQVFEPDETGRASFKKVINALQLIKNTLVDCELAWFVFDASFFTADGKPVIYTLMERLTPLKAYRVVPDDMSARVAAYRAFAEFLERVIICMQAEDAMYLDLKLANIGYKMCRTGPAFRLLDLDSVNDSVSTFGYGSNIYSFARQNPATASKAKLLLFENRQTLKNDMYFSAAVTLFQFGALLFWKRSRFDFAIAAMALPGQVPFNGMAFAWTNFKRLKSKPTSIQRLAQTALQTLGIYRDRLSKFAAEGDPEIQTITTRQIIETAIKGMDNYAYFLQVVANTPGRSSDIRTAIERARVTPAPAPPVPRGRPPPSMPVIQSRSPAPISIPSPPPLDPSLFDGFDDLGNFGELEGIDPDADPVALAATFGDVYLFIKTPEDSRKRTGEDGASPGNARQHRRR